MSTLVVCDSCGTERRVLEGWYELARWPEPTRHACSVGCLRAVVGELEETEPTPEGSS